MYCDIRSSEYTFRASNPLEIVKKRHPMLDVWREGNSLMTRVSDNTVPLYRCNNDDEFELTTRGLACLIVKHLGHDAKFRREGNIVLVFKGNNLYALLEKTSEKDIKIHTNS